MRKTSKKIVSAFLIIPLFSVITFCCCLEKNADASDEHSMAHHQELEKSDHHSEHQHHSGGEDECSCPKHFSFLSEQPFDLAPNLSSFQLLAKDFLAIPQFETIHLSFSYLYALGPPGQDYRDYASIPLFLKNSNLRI